MSTTYKEYRTENDEPILVEAARRDGDGKNIKNNYAKQNGYYGAMGVGHADSAKSLDTEVGNEDETPFNYATVGIDSDVETGMQELKKLVGVKLVKNQHVEITNQSSVISGGLTLTTNATTRIIQASGTPTVGYAGFGTMRNFVAGHKYLNMVRVIKNTGNKVFMITALGTNVPGIGLNIGAPGFYATIKESAHTGSQCNFGWVNVSTTETYDFELESDVIDITQRYGSNDVVNAIIGSDTSKQVERLLAFDPDILKETDYDVGSFTTCKSAKLKTIDYNRWNENFGVAFDGRYGSVDYIRVKPNTQYMFSEPNSQLYVIKGYDVNYNPMSISLTSQGGGKFLFTTPMNCAYIKFNLGSGYGTTYKNDICIFEYWDGSRIGYEPYSEHIIDLPNKDLNGILKVVDGKVVADGDELYPDNTKNKKRYMIIDAGSIPWGYHTATVGHEHFYWNVGTAKKVPGNVIGDLIIERKLSAATNTDIYMHSQDNVICITNGGNLNVYCSSCTSGNELKELLSGVYLIFALEESAYEDLEAPSYPGNFYGDDFGTMQFLDEDGNPIEGLQGCEIFYKANVAGFAESLYVKTGGDPDDLVTQEDLIPLNTKDAQLLNALGGTLRNMLSIKESLDFDNTDFVDLGELNWNYIESWNGYNLFWCNFNNMEFDMNVIKGLCTKYKVVTSNNFGDKRLYMNSGYISSQVATIGISDSSYSDAATFKAAMKGVLLAYKKVSS